MIKVSLLYAQAHLPTRNTQLSAGFDLHSIENVAIPPHGRAVIRTGICFPQGLPRNVVGQVWSRTGLSASHHLHVSAGIIDPDFTGEIKVVLFNLSARQEYRVETGDRIAQLVLVYQYMTTLVDSMAVAPPTLATSPPSSAGQQAPRNRRGRRSRQRRNRNHNGARDAANTTCSPSRSRSISRSRSRTPPRIPSTTLPTKSPQRMSPR